jgi:hypothetical protein
MVSPRQHVGLMVGLTTVGLLAVIGLVVVLLTLGTSPSRLHLRPQPREVPRPVVEPQLFAPTSVWNRPLAADTGIAPGSQAMIGALTTEVKRELRVGIGPWIGTKGTASLYVVGERQPTTRVQLSDPTLPWRRALQSAFAAVPIPADARPAAGTDSEMTVWQPSTDRMWEFFEMHRLKDGWHAAWGGAMQHVSHSPGYYTPASWPGASPLWGATATSLPAEAGVITLADIRQGHIDHALALNLPYPRAGEWTWPAQRSDGTGGSGDDIPEGSRLRLDPKLDLAALHLPRLALMIAQAAQQYGIIVRDQTHDAIGFSAEDPPTNGPDPYYANGVPRVNGPFEGYSPIDLLRRFPWSHLSVVAAELCRDSRGAPIARVSVQAQATTATRCGQL